MNRDIYQTITDRFIDQLKKGTVPWQMPWRGAQNIVSRKPYRGINSLLLDSAEFQSPFWLTFKQTFDLGGNVKKGAKSTPVIYYKFLEKTDAAGNPVHCDNGKPKRIPFVRWSNVFNLDQTEGIEPPAIKPSRNDLSANDRAAAIVQEAKLCSIYHAGFTALYSPRDDVIRIPVPASFYSPEGYYHTLFHEMTHATGHGSRLDREGVTNPVKFGSERYSKEELIAELGAAFLSNEAGILNGVQFENSAAYLDSWISKLENDPKLIVTAASQAQRGADFVLGIEQTESLTENHLSPEGMPLTWAREHGIDTRVSGFAQGDHDGDGVSTLMEWKHGTDPLVRHSTPRKQGMAL
jgi:antirestriction protein ArdC